MNKERVKAIFLELTGKPEITPYLLYTDCAAEKVSRLIKPEFRENIPDCVHSYAAALAAQMLSFRDSAGDGLVCTEAGTAPAQRDTSDRRAAADVQADLWKAICAPYLFDEEFVMRSIGKERPPHAESISSEAENTD